MATTGRSLTLLADANVLIDFAQVDGLKVMMQFGSIEVLDVVFDECQSPQGIQDRIQAVGMTLVTVQEAWVSGAKPYRQGRLSLQDALCFYYAKIRGRILLTNEKPLRKLCQTEGVVCHGTLWLIREAHRRSLVPSPKLCRWLQDMQAQGSRMPQSELADLRKTLKCLLSENHP